LNEPGPLRSNTVFAFSLCLFGSVAQSAALTVLIPPTIPGTISILRDLLFIYIALGVITFVYWLVHTPDYTAINRPPLGIQLMTLQIAILGLVFVIEGIVLLLLPVAGIVGIVLAGLGIGFFKLAKGLIDGDVWALEIMLVVTAIGIIAGIVLGLVVSQLSFGIPLLSLFQLWYLRRPNVAKFFDVESTYPRSSYGLKEAGRELARISEGSI
jgi:hypothetical protein